MNKIVLLAKLLNSTGAYEETDFVIRQAGQFGNDKAVPVDLDGPGNARLWLYDSDQEYSDGSQTPQEERMTKGPYWEGRHGPKDKSNLATDDDDYANRPGEKQDDSMIPPTEMNNTPDDGIAYNTPPLFRDPATMVHDQEDLTENYGYDETHDEEQGAKPYMKYLLQ